MDLGMYHGTATPHHHKGVKTEFTTVINNIENAVRKAVIPTLDELFIDEATAVACYITSHGSTMFLSYMKGKEKTRSRIIPDIMMQLAEEARVKATVAANRVAKPYLDTLDYYEAVAATTYISAYFGGVFSEYLLIRGIALSSMKCNRLSTAEKAEQQLDRIREAAGL